MARPLILAIELIIAITLIVLLNIRDVSDIDDTVTLWLDRGATWSVYALLVSLGLIFVRRRYLWIEVIVIAVALPLAIIGLTPTQGPDFGAGLMAKLFPGLAIGAAVSLLYKVTSLTLGRREERQKRRSKLQT